jgi:hypothetical protein
VPSFLDDAAKDYLFDARRQGIIKKTGVGASCINIELLHAAELSEWDILQYENGPYFNTDKLVKMFPDQIHIYHSALKYLHLTTLKGYTKKEVAAIILAHGIINNPTGKILFSSSRAQHISENISLVKQFLKAPAFTNKIFCDAIY